ncbi:MAG: hypothetical protein L0Y32_02240 [Nevskiales bacterium]|nr:hypothetical protein [Nevskiales bacterium]
MNKQFRLAARPVGSIAPARKPANYLSLLVDRAHMESMVILDYARRYGEAAREMAP